MKMKKADSRGGGEMDMVLRAAEDPKEEDTSKLSKTFILFSTYLKGVVKGGGLVKVLVCCKTHRWTYFLRAR